MNAVRAVDVVSAALAAGSAVTPMVTIQAEVSGRTVAVRLKLESSNSYGSIKDRTAASLIQSIAHRLDSPRATIVESTSGNLGVALAEWALRLDRRFVAVVDPSLSPISEVRLIKAGAQLVKVSEPDEHGSYLPARLTRVTQLLDEVPEVVWTDQYNSPANPSAHERWTGPQLLSQAADMDAVFIAVSTGGTLAGISRFLRQRAPQVRVVAVDVPGSRVFAQPTGARLLPGVGASRASAFLRPGDWDDVVIVDDADAISMCHEVRRSTGLSIGGSSGAVILACLRHLESRPSTLAPVCVCADGGSAYLQTLYDADWLRSSGVSLEARLPHYSLRKVGQVGAASDYR